MRQSNTTNRKTFQSTPPRGGRPAAVIAPNLTNVFQSTPPRGGRRGLSTGMTPRPPIFQSTPPRGGRRPDGTAIRSRSTHFNPRPREGGDLRTGVALGQNLISIHAPARGAPPPSLDSFRIVNRFQSTPPRGGRPIPPKNTAHKTYFNPRPREGGDKMAQLR